MKQALHIFLKDVRRLRLQLAALMLAIAYFVFLDARFPARSPMLNVSAGLDAIEFIVVATVWFLIARCVHEESLPDEHQFWLTRPYERGSLLASKAMMAVLAVIVPLFVADCVFLSIESLPVAGNMGGLVLRQFITAAWLILPPLAVASVTRTLTEDVMVWLVALAIVVAYFPGTTIPDFRAVNEKYAIIVALVLMLAVVWRQYSTRGTRGSRAMIAVAVLLPTLPFPEPVALAIEGRGNNAETSGILLAAKAESIAEPPPMGVFNLHCATVDVSVSGMQPDWRLAVLSQKDAFEAGGKTWSMGWRQAAGNGFVRNFDESGTAGNISACLTADGLKELGVGQPLSLHLTLALAVFAEDPPIRINATLQPFAVPGIGECQIQYVSRIEEYFLGCRAPVWFPREGRVRIGPTDSSNTQISSFGYPWTPMNLLPGLSPVLKWNTLPTDPEIREAVENHGQIEFRPETRIAVLRREVTVKEARFVESQ